MTLTVFIRYQLDPFKRNQFEEYAQALADDHPGLRRQLPRLLDAA